MAKERKRRALSRTAESILRAEETKARIRAACAADTEQVLALLDGEVLSEADVQARREKFGANALPAPAKKGAVRRLLAAFVNPFTAGGAALLCVLPYTAFGRAVGLCALPAVWFAVFAGIVVAYVSVAQLCKFAYVRRFGELL